MSMRVIIYKPEYKNIWDSFIDNSKNGTFMLKRDYMDYHSDRFIDNSLMFYEDDKLIAVMPASLHGDELRSHGGLTYGGVISDRKITTPKMVELFEYLKNYLKEYHIKSLLYKRVPYIYYSYLSDEDLYALFINNAKLVRRDISTCIFLKDKIPFNERRRRNIKKATKANLRVEQSFDFTKYINLVNSVLAQYHQTNAVHTGEELQILAQKFPEAIKLYVTLNEQNEMLAGTLIFETANVIHTQYIANSNAGREVGAFDIIIDYLIKLYADKKEFLDFGISNENDGLYLNQGLICQKQEFGGRGVAHDFYKLEI